MDEMREENRRDRRGFNEKTRLQILEFIGAKGRPQN